MAESSVLLPASRDAKASAIKEAPSRKTSKGRELSNDTNFLSSLLILETFEEVLLMVKNDLLELVSFGSDEKYSFGSDATDFRLAIVRLVSILIFTIHNVIMRSDNPQTLVYGITLGKVVFKENIRWICLCYIQQHNMSFN
ncbi:hypothetical protein T459_11898 [Capsicum annuum]|uniref:Uncharacterized protein n=1 Tax=Capsicum annuum TaxID=4072 RepID=A0A2G2ZND6_CAPAN|nr:hypothetical protein T459_11898 [Capsicum annuum]